MSGSLSAENVEHIYAECLVRDDEVGVEMIVAECATAVGFHSGRINHYRLFILSMLAELNERFRSPHGMDFYAASETWDGVRWVGEDGREDRLIEMLVLLGLAVEAVRYIIPLKDCTDFPAFQVILNP